MTDYDEKDLAIVAVTLITVIAIITVACVPTAPVGDIVIPAYTGLFGVAVGRASK